MDIYLCQYVKILQSFLLKEHHMMSVFVSFFNNLLMKLKNQCGTYKDEV